MKFTACFVFAAASLLLCALPSCKHEEKFPTLGTAIVSPVDVAASDDGQHFYVLNADMDRTYNAGSVLVLDKDGNKINAVKVPRMGRSLTIAGNDMLVSTDFEDTAKGAALMLFSLDDPLNPRLVQKWDLDCSPFNAVLRKGYPYFAFTCVDGQVYIGELTADRLQSQLHRVRRYGYSRRALHIDPQRGLLFGFPTDASKQNTSEIIFADVAHFDETGHPAEPAGPDEVPDVMQDDSKAVTNLSQRELFQFYVLDINKVAAGGFVDLIPGDPSMKAEMRWLYFNLSNFDGTPDRHLDGIDGSHDADSKYYRTNFWSAQPDPDDPNVFFLSHRGPPAGKDGSLGSPNANDIVKVTITGDPHPTAGTKTVTTIDPKTNETTTTEVPADIAPLTTSYMRFERVYGFKERVSATAADVSKFYYPSDFRVANVDGQKIVMVNNFRDLVNWVRKDTYFSVTAATISDDSLWFDESCPDSVAHPDWQGCTNTDPNWSWYQIAVTNEGRALSCSFYGNAVMLLDVRPGLGIKLVKRIN